MDDTSSFDQDLVAQTAPANWQNPRASARYNLVVVGGGPAGLVAAVGAAGLGARVALIEKHRLGGDCLNYGCVPSKALLRSAKAIGELRRALELGIRVPGGFAVDFPAVMERMRRLRAKIGRRDSAERFRQLGIDVFLGAPRFTAPDALEIAGQTLRFARAAITTGARAATLKLPGLAEAGFLTNESIFDLTELPRRLVVVGAGPVGCELAQAFRRFGSEVHLIDLLPRPLPQDDPEASALVGKQLEGEGIRMHLGVKATGALKDGAARFFHLEQAGQAVQLPADAILMAVGRKANVEDLGLDAAGVKHSPTGIEVNDFLQTTNPHIYAAGDVCSPFKLTHAADAMARILLRNALFFGRARASNLIIPWCTYTDPEVAHVGLTPEAARQRGLGIDSLRARFDEVDRAVLDGDEGFAVVHLKAGTDRIVGATVVAAHAGDLIGEVVAAMTDGRGLGTLARTIHSYPTQAEVWKKIADARQRTRLTPFRARLLQRLLSWRR